MDNKSGRGEAVAGQLSGSDDRFASGGMDELAAAAAAQRNSPEKEEQEDEEERGRGGHGQEGIEADSLTVQGMGVGESSIGGVIDDHLSGLYSRISAMREKEVEVC